MRLATIFRHAAAAAVIAVAAAAARADTFLLKSGARLYGKVESESVDENKTAWMVVRTTFGTVRFRKSELKRQLAVKGADDTIHLEEIRAIHVAGDVRRSQDAGKTWSALRMPGSSRTSSVAVWPELDPGDRLHTGPDGRADIDLGFGVMRVEPGSEVTFLLEAKATVSVTQGQVGVDVEPQEGKRKFRIETPQASMGVRGTLFLVRVGEVTRVGVANGIVDVAGADVGEDAAVEIAAGGLRTEGKLDVAERKWLAQVTYAVPFADTDWVVVPAGKFTMGGPMTAPTVPSPLPAHEVTMGAFAMCRTEATWAQFDTFIRWTERYGQEAVRPPGVASVTIPPTGQGVYSTTPYIPRTSDEQPAIVGWNLAWGFALWSGSRLSSEAEWEYAARAGTNTPYWFGKHHSAVGDREWVLYSSGDTRVPYVEEWKAASSADQIRMSQEYKASAGCRPHPCGTGSANPFGIYDLIGNVSEWCQDAEHPDYAGAPADGRAWESGPTARRIVRGGHYHSISFEALGRAAAPTDEGSGQGRAIRLSRSLRGVTR